jgi:hypothetical protein
MTSNKRTIEDYGTYRIKGIQMMFIFTIDKFYSSIGFFEVIAN